MLIRNNLSNTCTCFPHGSQIVIFELYPEHPGYIEVNSGYIRYLLDRKDLYAVIGQPKYPNDLFLQYQGWFDLMCGFKKEKPVFAFRHKDTSLERLPFLLQVNSTGKKELPRLQWNLYDISTSEPPKQVAAGKNIGSYYEYVNNNKLEPLNIAFSPDKSSQQEEFIDETTAAQIGTAGSILKDAINFGPHFTLKHVSVVTADNGLSLRLLIKVNSLPDKPFKLGYRLNKKGRNVMNIWDFAFAGDNILVTLPIDSTTKEMSFELMNVVSWPFKPLIIQGIKYDSTTAFFGIN